MFGQSHHQTVPQVRGSLALQPAVGDLPGRGIADVNRILGRVARAFETVADVVSEGVDGGGGAVREVLLVVRDIRPLFAVIKPVLPSDGRVAASAVVELAARGRGRARGDGLGLGLGLGLSLGLGLGGGGDLGNSLGLAWVGDRDCVRDDLGDGYWGLGDGWARCGDGLSLGHSRISDGLGLSHAGLGNGGTIRRRDRRTACVRNRDRDGAGICQALRGWQARQTARSRRSSRDRDGGDIRGNGTVSDRDRRALLSCGREGDDICCSRWDVNIIVLQAGCANVLTAGLYWFQPPFQWGIVGRHWRQGQLVVRRRRCYHQAQSPYPRAGVVFH